MRNLASDRTKFGFDKVGMPLRAALIAFFFLGVAGAIVVGGMGFVRYQPANLDFVAKHKPGTPVQLTIQTVGDLGPGHIEPDWVSYLTKSPDGKWARTTQWVMPAHTVVDVTEYEYDTGSPLRNQYWGKITGITGDKYTLYLKGNMKHPVTVGQLNSYAGNGVAHTLTVPALGINVPWYAISGNAPNQCSQAPCSTKYTHNVIKFSFRTPGPGQYHWQCFIPCGSGYLDGNGGPMETLGYMGGYLKVVNQ